VTVAGEAPAPVAAPARPRTGAVVVAAGRSRRMAGLDKVMTPLAGRPLVMHSLLAFQQCDRIDEIVVVTREELEERVHRMAESAGCAKLRHVVRGGETRAESSRHGLGAISKDVQLVLVHDAARPLVTPSLIAQVADTAASTGAANPALEPVATIKRAADGAVAATLDRTALREAQTPQAFRRDLLSKAFVRATRDGFAGTDEASLVERLDVPVAIVPGERRNVKITVPEDLAVAEALLTGGALPRQTRIGFGYDVHRLVEGRRLVLGGVEIPHPKGLLGHSDADVVAHAICDALLGAGSLGDIGRRFPDSDATWKDAPGEKLLARTVEILRLSGYVPVNVDVTVSAQAPRLAPHRDAMIGNVARALALPESRVSVKFTTTERLGFEGREEGVAATAVALVGRIPLVPEVR
jgi:2-C-methyl-D-erythritol 4-phosphate cytidylyltransferase/2-C-methyl-D-erythritol 2,4-cyclodiphosphate synthase